MSLSQILRDALARAAGAAPGSIVHDDLDALARSWVEDPAMERALADQDRIDGDLWK